MGASDPGAARILLSQRGPWPPPTPREQDLDLAQVALAAALASEGLMVVSEPPAEVALRLVPARGPRWPGFLTGRGDADRVRPRLALVPELEPGADWLDAAERYAVVDEGAAATLIGRGVPVERVRVTGWPLLPSWGRAATADRGALRERFGLEHAARIVVVDTRGLDEDALGALLVQLSLLDELELLFDAPDEGAAAVLRERCPRLGMRARRFDSTTAGDDTPSFYRAADVVVGRPRPALVAQARLCGLALVALGDEGEREAHGVEQRGLGRAAMISAAGAKAAVALRLLTDGRLAQAQEAALRSARPDAARDLARLAAEVVRQRETILAEAARATTTGTTATPSNDPNIIDAEAVEVGPAGPFEEVGVSPEELRRAALERRAAELEAERGRRDLDERLAALKAKLKPPR